MTNLTVLKNYNLISKDYKAITDLTYAIVTVNSMCQPDGKEPSITTKLVLYVIHTKPHKTELGGIASF